MVFRKMAGDMGLKWPVRPIFGCQRDPLARSFLTTTQDGFSCNKAAITSLYVPTLAVTSVFKTTIRELRSFQGRRVQLYCSTWSMSARRTGSPPEPFWKVSCSLWQITLTELLYRWDEGKYDTVSVSCFINLYDSDGRRRRSPFARLSRWKAISNCQLGLLISRSNTAETGP